MLKSVFYKVASSTCSIYEGSKSRSKTKGKETKVVIFEIPAKNEIV